MNRFRIILLIAIALCLLLAAAVARLAAGRWLEIGIGLLFGLLLVLPFALIAGWHLRRLDGGQ